jgi:hypothetical protein
MIFNKPSSDCLVIVGGRKATIQKVGGRREKGQSSASDQPTTKKEPFNRPKPNQKDDGQSIAFSTCRPFLAVIYCLAQPSTTQLSSLPVSQAKSSLKFHSNHRVRRNKERKSIVSCWVRRIDGWMIHQRNCQIGWQES